MRSLALSLCRYAQCPSCVARQAIAQIHFAFVVNYSLSANMLHARRAINLLLFSMKRRFSSSILWNAKTNELPSLWNDQVECGCYQSMWVIFEVSVFMQCMLVCVVCMRNEEDCCNAIYGQRMVLLITARLHKITAISNRWWFHVRKSTNINRTKSERTYSSARIEINFIDGNQFPVWCKKRNGNCSSLN